ncbi:hypothetical protein KI387_017152, partial [Taxus chinensis]
GDDWTSKWTYKDLTPIGATDTLTMDKASKGLTIGGRSSGGTTTYSIVRRSIDIPPSLSGVVDRSGDTMHRKNDENYDQVTNLSEEMRDADLHKLFKLSGHIKHVYTAMDQKIGISRGFGFVNFINKEDTQRAINNLDGYGYDNHFLKDEWATPM